MNARWLLALMLILGGGAAAPVVADEADYYKACYLQSDERDFATAAKLFEQTAGDTAVPADIRKTAARRLAECREEIAAADLAGLMPAESIAYVQFANIGAQAKTILQSLGLTGNTGDDERASDGRRIPIEEGLSFPIDFALSPALVREISKLGGAAAALTGFGQQGVPQGVVVIHVGDSDLVRGLVETGMQVVTPNESIEGYTTYRIPVEHELELWVAQTERLLVLSPSRDEISAVIGRIKSGNTGESLKDSASFRSAADARDSSLLFAWADSQRAAPLVYAAMAAEMQPQELMAASAIMNLPQIECATFTLGATEGGAQAEASIRFKPGHQHLVYGLLRTAPIGVDALQHVPRDAAAVAAIGLNLPQEGAARTASAAPPQIALMDLGRELFANVRSATVFMTPGEGPLPEVGVVVFAQDAEKSRELWNQLIGLPARLGFAPPEAAGEAEIAGHKATRYAYPDAPPIFVSQPSDSSLVIGTAGAVESSLAAADADKKGGATQLLAHANSTTSKAVFLQFGSLARFAARHAHGHEAQHMAAVAPLLDNTTASLTIDEDRNELRVRLELTDVPRVGEVLQTITGRNGAAGELQAAK